MSNNPGPKIDIPTLFPELAPRARQTVKLNPYPSNNSAPGNSKMGGTFLWPADEPWPVCDIPEHALLDSNLSYETIFQPDGPEHNDYYVGVLQLRKEDVPELGFPEGKNLFQLLWCPRRHNNFSVYSNIFPLKFFWRNTKEIINPLSQPPKPKNPEKNFIPDDSRLNFERLTEYPHFFDLSPELDEVLDQRLIGFQDESNLIYQQFSTILGTKIGGYPYWARGGAAPNCKCGSEMDFFLTVSEDINLDLQAGIIYLFICRRCAELPIDYFYLW